MNEDGSLVFDEETNMVGLCHYGNPVPRLDLSKLPMGTKCFVSGFDLGMRVRNNIAKPAFHIKEMIFLTNGQLDAMYAYMYGGSMTKSGISKLAISATPVCLFAKAGAAESDGEEEEVAVQRPKRRADEGGEGKKSRRI
jgi:hypothetical protein